MKVQNISPIIDPYIPILLDKKLQSIVNTISAREPIDKDDISYLINEISKSKDYSQKQILAPLLIP
jgi:hypothetical protein